MVSDREKLTSVQLAKIVAGFEVGYRFYVDERMQLLAGDFIAKAYQPEQAIVAIERMATSAADRKDRTLLLVALESVMRAC